AHEAARLVEGARQRVELAPERAGDLEVVALVAHDVEEGLVAAELEVFARRVGAERFVGLPVRIAPVVQERLTRGRHAKEIGPAQLLSVLAEHANIEIGWIGNSKAVDDSGETAPLQARARGQAHDRAASLQPQQS